MLLSGFGGHRWSEGAALRRSLADAPKALLGRGILENELKSNLYSPSELYDQLDPGVKNELETKLGPLIEYHRQIAGFVRCWEEAKHGRGDSLLWKNWRAHLKFIEHLGLEDVTEFWTDYEEYHWGQFIDAKTIAKADTFAALLLPVRNHIEKLGTGFEYLEQTSRQLSVILTISAGILYTAARLMILVLLFTCLRSTPAGVYESTPWTRFLPNVS